VPEGEFTAKGACRAGTPALLRDDCRGGLCQQPTSATSNSRIGLSEIEYLHVKLSRHDVIFAQGAPSETLLVQSGNVERFDNFAEYLRLFGEGAADEACRAPIAFGGRRKRLMSHLRSAVSPWVDCRNKFDRARDRIEELADLVKS
jgi:hypothetical protein